MEYTLKEVVPGSLFECYGENYIKLSHKKIYILGDSECYTIEIDSVPSIYNLYGYVPQKLL